MQIVKLRQNTLLAVIVALLLPVYWIGSEFWYSHHIQPNGISTVADFFERFGQARRIRKVEREGVVYFHLSGTLPPLYVLAVPSAPPVYAFDQSGHFVEWCRDPGDSNAYWERWPKQGNQTIDLNDFKHRYGR